MSLNPSWYLYFIKAPISVSEWMNGCLFHLCNLLQQVFIESLYGPSTFLGAEDSAVNKTDT